MNDSTTTAPAQFSLRQLMLGMAVVCGFLGVWLTMEWLVASLLTFALSLWMVTWTQSRRRHPYATVAIRFATASGMVFFVFLIAWGLLGIGPIYYSKCYPNGLKHMLAASGGSTWGTKVKCLSGFLDRQYVWRICVDEAQMSRVATDCGLFVVQTENVPAEFYGLFPRRWRPPIDEQVRYYSTAGFSVNDRGADGLHYCAAYDAESEKLYVWCKDNF